MSIFKTVGKTMKTQVFAFLSFFSVCYGPGT